MFLDVISVLSSAFACLATLLAASGLYGVLAYTVTLRHSGIGLRIALGAAPSRVRDVFCLGCDDGRCGQRDWTAPRRPYGLEDLPSRCSIS